MVCAAMRCGSRDLPLCVCIGSVDRFRIDCAGHHQRSADGAVCMDRCSGRFPGRDDPVRQENGQAGRGNLRLCGLLLSLYSANGFFDWRHTAPEPYAVAEPSDFRRGRSLVPDIGKECKKKEDKAQGKSAAVNINKAHFLRRLGRGDRCTKSFTICTNGGNRSFAAQI